MAFGQSILLHVTIKNLKLKMFTGYKRSKVHDKINKKTKKN